MEWLLAIASIIGLVIVFNVHKDRQAKAEARAAYEKRRNGLLAKYQGNSDVVNAIMAGRIWVGQSREQVIDSLGMPAGVEEKVMKAKVRHTLKYGVSGRTYRLKITLEDGRVVGWDAK